MGRPAMLPEALPELVSLLRRVDITVVLVRGNLQRFSLSVRQIMVGNVCHPTIISTCGR